MKLLIVVDKLLTGFDAGRVRGNGAGAIASVRPQRYRRSRPEAVPASNAIKMYYESMLGQTLDPIIVKRPSKEKKLPTVLSEDGITVIFNRSRFSSTGACSISCILLACVEVSC
jgi:hypothetical protein